jgi:hypothetical protein
MPRCPDAMPECVTRSPEMYQVDGAEVRCFLYEGPAEETA